MLFSSLFIVSRNWEQGRCASVGECICSMEYYLAIKRHKLLIDGTLGWIAEELTLNEKNLKKIQAFFYTALLK